MEFEPWMLLVFPLFFGMGWLAARIDIKEILSENHALPQSYFKGLNFLLNEQQDKAIEAFIEVVKVDPQTVELHFALGSLFRRRGEVDRALRMHHNLVDRADLDNARRQQAIFELAQDYLKAGILDRAESLFRELRKSAYAKQSLEFLLELFQKERDWLKAIDAARQLAEISGESRNKLIALFYCELAQEELTAGHQDAAHEHLQQALKACPDCVRASIMFGDMAMANGDREGAIAYWKTIETQDSRYLPLVSERLLQVFAELGRESEGIALLRGYLDKYHSVDMMNVLFAAVSRSEGAAAAYQLVRDALHKNPSLIGLDKLLEARLLEVPAERRADVELVRNLLQQRTRNLAMYHCRQCGFKARQFYWHCPACQSWDSYLPRRTEETELQS